MAQLVVRKLDDGVKERLRLRAARNGHSMEEEVRTILTDAVLDEALGNHVENEGRERRGGLGSEIAALFANIPPGPPLVIEELRGYPAVPWNFDWIDDNEDDAKEDADESDG